MEALAQDLSLALQESSKELQQTVRRHNRKRKGKVRRNSNGVGDDMSLYNSVDFPNRSEASAGSDIDSILRSQQNQISYLQLANNITPIHPIPLHIRKTLSPAVEATTDSEDQCSRIANKLSALSLPANNSLVSGGDLESDSVNDLQIEKKTTDHARRRRRAKLNASPSIIVGSLPDERSFTPEHERKSKPRPHGRKKEVMETDNAGGDRKHKSQRMDSEPAGAGYIPMLNADTGYYDISSESSQLTSDGAETCDDQAGEADDEQSDFFHEFEPGPTYGIPIKSRDMLVNEHDDQTPTNKLQFQGIIHQTFPHLAYSTKLKRTRYGKYGRPIRTGYRRLKSSKMHSSQAYQSSSEQSQDCFLAPNSVTYSSDNKSPKRRRQYLQSNTGNSAPTSNSGDMKPYNMQMPSNLSWTSSSPFTSRGNSALGNIFTNTPSYRSSNGSCSGSTRRRRRPAANNIPSIANHTHVLKKSGST